LRSSAASAQRQLLVIGPESSETFCELPGGHAGVSDVAVRVDAKIWATGGWDGRVRLFDAKKRRALAVLKHDNGGVHTVGFSLDGLLASAGQGRRALVALPKVTWWTSDETW
jgi:WD40 repeat protein